MIVLLNPSVAPIFLFFWLGNPDVEFVVCESY